MPFCKYKIINVLNRKWLLAYAIVMFIFIFYTFLSFLELRCCQPMYIPKPDRQTKNFLLLMVFSKTTQIYIFVPMCNKF